MIIIKTPLRSQTFPFVLGQGADFVAIVLSEQELRHIVRNPDFLGDKALEGCSVDTRRVGDMRDFFFEPTDELDDQIVYEVFAWPENGETTDLLATITVLHPGSIGTEPFHTKGHFHNDPDGPEFVVGYHGTGILQLGDHTGRVTDLEVSKGTHVWIPPGTAHRVINRSSEPVTYLSISSAYVGHDYDAVVALHWKQNITRRLKHEKVCHPVGRGVSPSPGRVRCDR